MAGARAVAPGFFPLDEQLACGRGGVTPTVHELIVLLGTHLPFACAAQLLERFVGVRISPSTVRRFTETAGVALCAVETAFVERVGRELPDAPVGPAEQLMSVDGAMVPVVGGEWREVKTVAIGAIHRTPDGPCTTDQLSYCSRMSDVETFSQSVTGECHRRGTARARVVAAVADGAPWCQQVFDDQVPGSVRILDFPHAVGHLAEVAEAVFGRATTAANAWLALHRRILRDGDPELVLTALADVPVTTAADPAAAELIRDQVLAYFTKRRPQITYAAFRARGLPIGSGAVESANKQVVEARLKGAGMHWTPDNVNPMLALRAAWCSDRWDSSWDDLMRHRTTRTRTTASTTQSPVSIPRPAADLPRPPAQPPVPAKPPREKTIVNGKPTDQHPYRQANAARFKYLQMCNAKI
jgi:hypothetical protein